MLIKYFKKAIGLLDRVFVVQFVNYDTYFTIHKRLGFPIKKLTFLIHNGVKLNLNNPKGFNEKVSYRHLYERDPLLSEIVCKYEVREYVKNKTDEVKLIPLIGIYNSEDEIDFDNLPSDYILKTTHGSGQNFICKDGKLTSSIPKIKKTIKKWLHEKYRFQELIYFVQPIKKRIIIEELILTDKSELPKDYKIYVFNGKVEMIHVDTDRFGENHTRNFYDTKWNPIDLIIAYPHGLPDTKPILLEKMIRVAETLASQFTFMRVDLYLVGDTIYFGELTPAPGGGLDPLIPRKFEFIYGEKWGDNLGLLR